MEQPLAKVLKEKQKEKKKMSTKQRRLAYPRCKPMCRHQNRKLAGSATGLAAKREEIRYDKTWA